MNNSQLYLFYSPQNAELAEEVKNYLQKQAITVWENVDNETLEQGAKIETKVKILVLISDDFLKNIRCMRFALWLSQTELRPQLLPVLLYNKRQKPASEEYEWQPTQIYTVPDTVHYRDFWYEEWIRLRKKLNTCAEGEKMQLEADIAVAKKLQPAMNTVLSKFRDHQPLSYLKLQNDDYALFWERFQLYINPQIAEKQLEAIAEDEMIEKAQLAEDETVEKAQLAEIETEEKTQLAEDETAGKAQLAEDETVEKAQLAEDETVEKTQLAEIETKPQEIVIEPVEVEFSGEEISTAAVDNEPFSIDAEIEKMEKALQRVEQLENKQDEAITSPPAEEETASAPLISPQTQTHSIANLNLNPENTQMLSENQPNNLDEREFVLNLSTIPADFDEKLVYENYQIGELTDLDTLFCLAETESEEGDFDHAKTCYERILQLDPQNGRALIWLARLQHRFLNNPKGAEICYKKAILCSDESANLYYEYALLLSELGSYRRAVENLHSAVEIQPEFALAYAALAKNASALQQNDLAKMYYLQACALDESLQTAAYDEQYKVLRKPVDTETENIVEPKANNEFETKLIAETTAQKTVLVTGATSGIGQSVAEIFALQGFKLIIAGRREEYLLRWQESLEQRFDAKIYPLHIDVSDPQSVENAFLSLPEEFKNVDILINNAGLAKGFEPIHEGKLSHWNQMIDTNLKGMLYMINKVAAGMVARRNGHIINVGSAAGKQVYANGAVYCATKAAVDALTSAMRLDLYQHNVRVSAVHPGAVEDTEFSLVRYEDEEKAKIYDKFKPLAAYDVAEMIYYIATRPAYVNVQEVLMFATQQGSTYAVDKSGRDDR